jgi:hypothetical protein
MIRLRFNFGPRLPGRSALVTILVNGKKQIVTAYRYARTYL